jgi:large subunit ribosomal protein L30e
MDHAEAGKEIRRAVDTGKVLFGSKESLYSLKHGEGQLLVVTKNAPTLDLEEMAHIASLAKVPVYKFEGNGLELGNVCGKPYVISTLLVLDEGKSKVLQLGDAQAQAAEAATETTKKGRKKRAAN